MAHWEIAVPFTSPHGGKGTHFLRSSPAQLPRIRSGGPRGHRRCRQRGRRASPPRCRDRGTSLHHDPAHASPVVPYGAR